MLLLFIISLELNGTSVESFESTHGVRFLKNVSTFSIFEGSGHALRAPCDNCHFDYKKRQFKRYFRRGITDPLWASQWHLHGPHSVNADEIPDNVNGEGVTIGIVDDGLQFRHPDLSDNYSPELSKDYNGGGINPANSDGHGTSAAGVCCAARNNICGRGVAWKAKIGGIKLIADGVYDYQEAEAMLFKSPVGEHRMETSYRSFLEKSPEFHRILQNSTGFRGRSKAPASLLIKSNSWGPEDSGLDMVAPGPVMRRALSQTKSIIVWAAGNGRENRDNCNYDGYANNPNVFAIGAVDSDGQVAYYSEPCAALFAVAPSSGRSRGITTTDLMGPYGYSPGECTSSFGGTSSAAPLAAGVIALMLQQRPELKRRDIERIIAKAGNNTHSHDFGFGLLNIPRILTVTASHQLVSKERIVVRQGNIPGGMFPIPQNLWKSISLTPTPLNFVERILITVDFQHTRRGQVGFRLKSPRGSESILAELRGDSHSERTTWTFTSVHHWGEEIRQGDVWELKFNDFIVDANLGNIYGVTVEWRGT